MRSTGSGPLGALLMLAPLIAVPILAVVGIPQFAPGNLIDQRGTSSRSPRRDYQAPEETDVGEDRTAPIDELFKPVGETDQEIDHFQDPLAKRKSGRGQSGRAKLNDLEDFGPDSTDEENLDENGRAETADLDNESEEVERPNQRPRPGTRRPKADEQDFGGSAKVDRRDFESEADQGASEPDELAADMPTEKRIAPKFQGSKPNSKKGSFGSSGTGSRNSKVAEREPQESEDPANEESTETPAETPEPEADRAPAKPTADAEGAVDELTWQIATKRLRKLGVGARKQYFTYLADRDRFLFTCEATSPDAKSTKRFQAEADEPLLAVRQVLEKLEAWQKAGTKPRTRVLADRSDFQ